MATSPLDPSNLSGRKDRVLGRGHGTRALGPSDSSDSGSDLVGAPDFASPDAGAADGADIDTDHIEALPVDALDELEDASLAETEDRNRENDEEDEH